MGQVCDENISCLHSRSNSRTPPTPGRIPSAPALDRTPNAPPPQVPSPIGTRTQETRTQQTPAPSAQPEGGGLQNMGDGNLPCPTPTDKMPAKVPSLIRTNCTKTVPTLGDVREIREQQVLQLVAANETSQLRTGRRGGRLELTRRVQHDIVRASPRNVAV